MTTTVLIVDDSFVSRVWVETFLHQQHPSWQVLTAGSGAEAIKQAQGTEIDLMILDINMPAMDGFKLGTLLKQQSPKAYITMLSANTKEQTKKKCKDLGFDLVSKPISNEKMRAIVEKFAP